MYVTTLVLYAPSLDSIEHAQILYYFKYNVCSNSCATCIYGLCMHVWTLKSLLKKFQSRNGISMPNLTAKW